MRFVKPITTIVLISSCLLSGCTTETEEHIGKPPADVKSVKPVKEQNEVEEFLITEPSKDADTPGKAAVEQIQLTFKNGQTAVPTQDDILSETSRWLVLKHLRNHCHLSHHCRFRILKQNEKIARFPQLLTE
ncbi:hypothetical protein D3D03_08960 [Exiguobacterium sp. RIT452]|uniref:hypothetical protein n=1 Tax=Exiguobacterium sp. RIT452 TaxID=2315552 RepID=UPI000E759831|nr:hypothetical protein [Exiguobacterium sp. RIT452]RJP00913.1 hypothetical protein D3D03_08960 [Exiguobacterium sp. RIT452]